MMNTYEFHDIESGEDFFVEARTEEAAKETAREYFTSPIYYGEVDYAYAEAQGYDTY